MPLGTGYTEAIFATSHLTGFSYAPRLRTSSLNGSTSSAAGNPWIVRRGKLSRAAYCDEQYIIQFWDDVLRFIATINSRKTTASDIFRRLNSYSMQHGLYHALKAFGQILKNIFILRVIDEPVLRMSIEKVLSGIEHVHAFTRAVSVGNPREFLQAEKEDQEMAEACKRRIKNCIISEDKLQDSVGIKPQN
jgi:TnpA family transposase